MCRDRPDADELLEAFAQLPSYWRATAAPEHDRLAYYYDITGRFELYVHDLATGDRERITDGDLQRDPYEPVRWAPAGDRLYVHRNGPNADIYGIQLEDDRLTPVITGEDRYRLWDVGPTGRHLLYTRSGEGHDRQLYRYDRTEDAHSQLSRADEFVFARGNEFDPAGDRVLFAATETTDRADISECSVYVAASDGSDRRQLSVGREGIRTFGKAWGPRGRRILVYEPYEQGRSGVYDLETAAIRWYGDHDRDEKPVTFLLDGNRFLAIQKDHVDSIPVVHTIDGQHRHLDFDGLGTLDPTSSWDVVLGPDEILLPHSTTTEKGQLLRYDVTAGTGTPIARIDYGELDPSSFVEAEYRTFDSFDGLTIGGLLYEPRNTEEEHPALVIVHGGRHGRVARTFDWRAQLLVRLGYAVFMPNYRGSSGRGIDFKRRQTGDVGGGESKDVAAAGRWLADRPGVNGDRVGIYGHSHGGYLTALQMVTTPTLWTAGIASSGLWDLVAGYEDHPDLPGLQEMGDPNDDPELLRERSPISHVTALERPLMILHGVDDPVSSIEQARRFRTALLAAGHTEGEDFEYHELDERHGTMDADRKVQRWRLVVNFLDRRL